MLGGYCDTQPLFFDYANIGLCYGGDEIDGKSKTICDFYPVYLVESDSYREWSTQDDSQMVFVYLVTMG